MKGSMKLASSSEEARHSGDLRAARSDSISSNQSSATPSKSGRRASPGTGHSVALHEFAEAGNARTDRAVDVAPVAAELSFVDAGLLSYAID